MNLELEKELQALYIKIDKWNTAYYLNNESLVPDFYYDKIYTRIQEIEKEYPHLSFKDSPVNKVGGNVQQCFNSEKHIKPMLSIRTETKPTLEAFLEWRKTLEKKLGQSTNFVTEYKYDGLGLSLTYENNILKQALTRGDGNEGEDLTANAIYVLGIPNKLDAKELIDKIVIRGEVVMPHKAFEIANKFRALNNEQPFSNARNAAAGSLRQLDTTVTKNRHLCFLAYQIVHLYKNSKDNLPKSQREALEELKRLNFTVPDTNVSIENLLDENGLNKTAINLREELHYDIDGFVVKVDLEEHREILGFNNREPTWAVAYKFAPKETVSKLLSIDAQVGRTGRLTPVARIEPVSVGGTVISNVTLHNLFDLRNRKIRIGDTVFVRRAGDVIPEIVGYVKEDRKDYLPNYKIPSLCPVCNGKVVRQKGEREYCCTNTLNCKAQLKGTLLHYVARNALYIDGIGEKIIDKLIEKEVVKSIEDFYKLNKESFLNIEGIGNKTITNILKSIESSKETTFAKFLYGLGIKNVGENTSRILSKEYKSPLEISLETIDDLVKLKDIGQVTAESIYYFFNNKENFDKIQYIWNNHLIIKNEENKTDVLKGKTFVITGSFTTNSREEMNELIESKGGIVQKQVSSKTNYLLAGTGGGGKKADALKIGVQILNEEDFNLLINKP